MWLEVEGFTVQSFYAILLLVYAASCAFVRLRLGNLFGPHCLVRETCSTLVFACFSTLALNILCCVMEVSLLKKFYEFLCVCG